MQKATIQPQWVVEAIAARRQQRKEAWDNAEKKALEWKEKARILLSLSLSLSTRTIV